MKRINLIILLFCSIELLSQNKTILLKDVSSSLPDTIIDVTFLTHSFIDDLWINYESNGLRRVEGAKYDDNRLNSFVYTKESDKDIHETYIIDTV